MNEKQRTEIEENFEKIYRNFRLKLYKHIFDVMGECEGSLTATEFFAVETVGLMKNPTVSEFAEALSITSSHAAYKVRQLVSKGYLIKEPTEDKRSYRLAVTEKFTKYYHKQDSYGAYIFDMLSKTLTQEELLQTGKLFAKFVETIEKVQKGVNDD